MSMHEPHELLHRILASGIIGQVQPAACHSTHLCCFSLPQLCTEGSANKTCCFSHYNALNMPLNPCWACDLSFFFWQWIKKCDIGKPGNTHLTKPLPCILSGSHDCHFVYSNEHKHAQSLLVINNPIVCLLYPALTNHSFLFCFVIHGLQLFHSKV